MPHRLTLSIHNVINARTPADVLEALQKSVSSVVNVMGIWPLELIGFEPSSLPEDLPWHPSVSPAFCQEYLVRMAECGPPSVAEWAARTNPSAYTHTEAMQRLQPTGSERWIFDIMRDHGIRDGFVCPIGPWVIIYWSDQVLRGKTVLSEATRMMLHAGGAIALSRVKELRVGHKDLAEQEVELSQRELAVLRQLAMGKRLTDAAECLHISIATARTYLRRAQKKLDAETPLEAAVRTVRLGLI